MYAMRQPDKISTFILPKKWYCPYSNREEFDIMNEFYKGNWHFITPNGYYGCSPNESNNWFDKDKLDRHTKITFDQFKKYVMKESDLGINYNLVEKPIILQIKNNY